MSSKLLTVFGGSDDPVWIVRDQFAGTLAAGSVNGTATSDRQGIRVVADTASKISIADGLVVAGGATNYTGTVVSIQPAGGGTWPMTAGMGVLWRVNRSVAGITTVGNRGDALLNLTRPLLINATNGVQHYPYTIYGLVDQTLESVPLSTVVSLLHMWAPTRLFTLIRVAPETGWRLIYTAVDAIPNNAAAPALSNYSAVLTASEAALISLAANGETRLAADTDMATSFGTTVGATATGAHEAAYWLELNNVTVPSSGAITVNASVSGSDELTVSIAADGSIAVLENGVSRIAGAAGQITNGAIVRLRRSSATSCALFDDNSQVGATYASLAVPQGTTWAVTSLGTGGAIGAVYAWPYNVTLQGLAGRI